MIRFKSSGDVKLPEKHNFHHESLNDYGMLIKSNKKVIINIQVYKIYNQDL